MTRLTIVILLFLINITISKSQSTEGKKFWFGFMENYQDSNKIETSVFITSRFDTKGKLTLKNGRFEKQFKVKKDSSVKITIPSNLCMHLTSELVEDKGIYIEAEDDVNVYALNFKKHTSDATLIYPIEALGKHYMCIGYNDQAVNELLIVATEDDTQVEIIPNKITVNGKLNSFIISLARGQTYQIKFNGDLTGTEVKSLKYPIAVFSGVICTYVPPNVPACDHLFEQIPPINTLGYKYGIIPLKTRKGDTYKILAVKNNTNLYFDKSKEVTINKGKYIEKIIKDPTIVESNEPIMIAQLSNGQNYDSTNSDPFMIILSPMEQTRNNITFYAFTSEIIEDYYLNILMKTKDLHSLIIDNNKNLRHNFKPFPADSKYSFARLSISQGNHTVRSGGDGFIAYIYGFGNYESYGYSAGTRAEKITEFKFRIGLYGQYGMIDEKVQFSNFSKIPNCYRNLFEVCDNYDFDLSNARNYNLGALIEIPSLLTTPFGIGVRGGINYTPLDFVKTEYAFENTELQRDLLNEAYIDLFSFNVSPYLIFTFIENLNLYVGVNWTFNIFSNDKYTESIVQSRIKKEIANIIYENNSNFYDYSYQVLGGLIGFGYEFVLNEDRNYRISPEIFYFHNVISSNKEFDNYLNKITFGLSFKWGY